VYPNEYLFQPKPNLRQKYHGISAQMKRGNMPSFQKIGGFVACKGLRQKVFSVGNYQGVSKMAKEVAVACFENRTGGPY
jgi:hypothetical protein